MCKLRNIPESSNTVQNIYRYLFLFFSYFRGGVVSGKCWTFHKHRIYMKNWWICRSRLFFNADKFQSAFMHAPRNWYAHLMTDRQGFSSWKLSIHPFIRHLRITIWRKAASIICQHLGDMVVLSHPELLLALSEHIQADDTRRELLPLTLVADRAGFILPWYRKIRADSQTPSCSRAPLTNPFTHSSASNIKACIYPLRRTPMQ